MDRFAYDDCRIADRDRLFQNASNLTDLWWDEDKQSLINLYGMTTGENTERLSDYDKFRVLCRMMPMLDGHPVRRRCADFLKTNFQCDLTMNDENCDAIWQTTAQTLLLHPKCGADLIDSPIGLLWECETRPTNLPKMIRPILCAERLMNLCAPDWNTWKTLANEELDAFETSGCNRVLVHFADDFCFEKPNLYRVEQILKMSEKTVERCDLLLCQVVRFLCEACAARGWTLQFEIGNCVNDVLLLLHYAEQSVGLPKLLWSTKEGPTRDRMLAFGYQMHKNPIQPLLRGCDYSSDAELLAEMHAYAARYPMGMLLYACGVSLFDVASERRRFEMIEKWRKKDDKTDCC